MRTLILIVILLSVVSGVFAAETQPPAANSTGAQAGNGTVTLDLKEADLKSALEVLFKGWGKSYVLTEGAKTWMDSLKPTVQVNLRNVPFDDALKAVLGNYGFAVENGVYKIMDPEYYNEDYLPRLKSKTEKPAVAGGSATGAGAAWKGKPDMAVAIDIPAMPVEDAYKALVAKAKADPLGWTFDGSLGKTMMPGVSISRLSFRNAAQMLVAAAGLTPPKDPEKVVKSKLQGSFASVFHREYSVGYDSNGQCMLGSIGSSPEFGAYRKGNTWKYTAACDDCWVGDLLYPLFDVTGTNYSMSSLASPQDGYKITVRLVDMELEEVLDAILEPLGLTRAVNQTSGGETYIIGGAAAK